MASHNVGRNAFLDHDVVLPLAKVSSAVTACNVKVLMQSIFVPAVVQAVKIRGVAFVCWSEAKV